MHISLLGTKIDRKFTPWLIGLLGVGLIGTSITVYLVIRNSAPKTDINTLTVPVKAKTVTVRITASGTVRPVQTVNLSPKTSGRVAKLLVEQGDRVTQGQIIARMDSDDVDAQLIQAQANLDRTKAHLDELKAGNRPQEIAQAQAKLDQAQASLDLLRVGSRPEEVAQAKSSLAQAEAKVKDAQSWLDLATQRVIRNRQLATEGAISSDSLDGVLNEQRSRSSALEQAKAAVRELKQKLEQVQNGSRPEEIQRGEAELAEAKKSLELLQVGTRPEVITQTQADVAEAVGRLRAVEAQKEDTLVKAPFAGIITQKYATEGAFVTPTTSASASSSATSTSIVTLASTELEILADVPEVDISQIKLGQSVEIHADAYPDRIFKGNVRLIAPEAVKQENVTSFEVRIALAQGQIELLSGMNVDLTFLGQKLDNALVIPTVAIVTKNGQSGVLVPDENNQAEFRPITTGISLGNEIQIIKGIQAGDRVFVDLPKDQQPEDQKK